MEERPCLTRDALHIAALWAVAVCQPLLGLLGHSAEFFVVRRCEPGEVLLLLAALCLVAPALLALLLRVPRVWAAAKHVLLASLSALVALACFKKAAPGPGSALVVLAALTGLGFTLAYRRLRPVRMFLSMLAPAALVVPAVFLLNPKVQAVVFPSYPPPAGGTCACDTPVVFVVFDEFPLGSLLDDRRRVDRERYPNFAALAEGATWFRNATTVHQWTTQAVPALLTGRFVPAAGVPTRAHHPDNLFTLFAGSHDLRVVEPVTQLCPPHLNAARREPLPRRVRSLAQDLAVVQQHLVLPLDWARRLPPVNATWGDFSRGRHTQDDRPLQFEQFLDLIEPTSRPGLYFLHVCLPHSPFSFLPSGKCYGHDTASMGLDSDGRYIIDEDLTAHSQQRHLLQVGYVDALLGRLIERLRQAGLYDRCALVVTADHGISFLPRGHARKCGVANHPDILRVPLFVKAPRQRQGEVSERNVLSIDVLPTVASLVGVTPPWPVEGRSAFCPGDGARTEKVLLDEFGRWQVYPSDLGGQFGGLRRRLDRFGCGSMDRLYRHGPHAALIGRRVEDLRAPAASAAEVDLLSPDLFADVSLGSPFVPVLVQGVVRLAPGEEAVDVAVAVNGRVAAVTRVTRGDESASTLSVLVREEDIRAGANEVEVYEVAASPGASPRLRRTGGKQAPLGDGYTLRPRGASKEEIVDRQGKVYPVVKGSVQGCLDVAHREGGCVAFLGWAADVRAGELPEAVLVFADGQFLASARVGITRRDVAETVGAAGLKAGFNVSLPPERARDGRLRFFALSRRGEASELWYPRWCSPGPG